MLCLNNADNIQVCGAFSEVLLRICVFILSFFLLLFFISLLSVDKKS